MQLLTLICAFSTAVGAAPAARLDYRNTMNVMPFTFPLPNGFPNNISNATLQAIEQQAGGPFPSGGGGGATTKLSPTSVRALQAVAFNEIFEVAFFTQLLQNVTQSVEGYDLGPNRTAVMAALAASQAQEELHFLLANTGIKISGATPVQPCAYVFPVNNFTQAMHMADNFSSLLVGGISDLIQQFALGGDDTATVTTQFCSVLGQEGEQEGFFRSQQNKVPNASPFLTQTTLPFIYNHIRQHYIAPGSCTQDLGLPVFQTLTPLGTPPALNSTVWYTTTYQHVNSSNVIVYMSGQMAPLPVPISNIKAVQGGLTTFSAPFPYQAGFSRGLTVAALVGRNGSFGNVTAVSNVALAGPGVININ